MKDIGFVFYNYIVDCIKLSLFLIGIMNFRLNRKKNIYIGIGALQIIAVITSGLLIYQYQYSIMGLLSIFIIISICFILEGNFFRKLTYSILAYALILLLNAIIISLINMAGKSIISDQLLKLFNNILNIIIIGLAVLIRRRKNNIVTQTNLSRKVYLLLFAGAGTGTFVLTALLINTNSNVTEKVRLVMTAVTIIVIIIYCLVCLMLFFITESRDNYKALSLINQSVIESQQQYYLLVHEKQEEMRSIRHEMRNHLACIRGLYNANKLSEMEIYINQLVEESGAPDDLFDSGNDIVNAILNDAKSRYWKENIVIRLEGGFPEQLNIAPMDLCVIFANAISNAVEAIQRMEHKVDAIHYIDIKIGSYKEDIFIDIKNPTDSKLNIQNGKLLTSKKDKKHHGFGVKNIIQRVEKYQGNVDFSCNNNVFTVEIFMKNLSYK